MGRNLKRQYKARNVPQIPRIRVPASVADNPLLKVRHSVPGGKACCLSLEGWGLFSTVCVGGRVLFYPSKCLLKEWVKKAHWDSLTLNTPNGGVYEAFFLRGCPTTVGAHFTGNINIVASCSCCQRLSHRANYSHSRRNSNNFTFLPSLPRKIGDSVRISEM